MSECGVAIGEGMVDFFVIDSASERMRGVPVTPLGSPMPVDGPSPRIFARRDGLCPPTLLVGTTYHVATP
jgi:hypothetical protein